jgi:hypothetical protein
MPFNGLGTYTLPYDWTQDAANGINISSTRMEAQDTDMAGAFNNCLTRDGQGIPIANIAWGGFNLSGVGALSGASYSFSGNGSIGGNLTVTGTLNVGGTVTFTGSLSNDSGVLDGAAARRLIGYRNTPQTAKTASYQLAFTDVGQGVSTTAGVTVPPNSTTAFAIGDTIAVYNNSASSITITQGAGVTLRLVGTTTTGNRTLAARGLCTLLKVGTDEWVAGGGGLS